MVTVTMKMTTMTKVTTTRNIRTDAEDFVLWIEGVPRGETDVKDDDLFSHQPTIFCTLLVIREYHTMYTRHARLFEVQEYLSFSHSSLPVFLLQGHLIVTSSLIAPIETGASVSTL